VKHLLATVGACLLALFCHGAIAQKPETSSVIKSAVKAEPQRLKEITPEFRKQLLQNMVQYSQFRRFLFTDPIDCVIENGDICPILVQLVQVSDANGTYCVGLLPEVVSLHSTSPGNAPKRIVWKLVLPSPPVPNAEFYFHKENDHGIIWLSNFGSPPQMHTGRVGDGSSGSPDRTKYVVRNRHRATGEGVYVPIILQRDTTTGKISLCGTPDPRMVND
jgi:hypothetical protein